MIRNKGISQKISLFLPDLCVGGAERLTINLANEWSQKGFEIELVVLKAAKPNDDLGDYVLPSVKLVILNSSSLLRSVMPLFSYFRRAKPDISIAAMWPLTVVSVISWLLSGRCGKLFISDHTQLSISMLHEFKANKFFVRTSIFIFYNLASGIIAVSKGVQEDLCALGMLQKKSIRVIYNPASLHSFEKEAQTSDPFQELWQEPGYKILAVGTLKKQKDFITLINALNQVSMDKRVSLIILGEGPERPALEALIDSLGLSGNVSLPGYVIDTFPYFKCADLFVLSSAWEGFGNVLVEALECGTPIVSSNCKSGPSEILENGKYGKLVEVANHVEFARGIEEMLKADHNSEYLKQRATIFSVEKIALEYLDYFQKTT